MEQGSSATCPVCGRGELSVGSEDMEIPHFGKVVISSLHCVECGYRSTDVISVEDRPPSRYSFTVNDEEGLNVRVIRSSTSTLSIPEMGVTIQPGSAHEGYITNIEGVLKRVGSILDQIKGDLENRSGEFDDVEERLKKTSDLKERILRTIDGDISAFGPFTVILEDPQGNSALVNEDDTVIRKDLTETEILEMTKNLYG